MKFQKGHKKLGGRRKGTPNNPARQIAEKAAANGLTPLEYLVSVMRDETLELPVRLDAAKAACPFMHPRLNAIDARIGLDIGSSITPLSDAAMVDLLGVFDAAAELPLLPALPAPDEELEEEGER